jgi:hypothetical protein
MPSVFKVLYSENSYFKINIDVFEKYKLHGGHAKHELDSDILRYDPIMIQLFEELGSEAVSGDNGAGINIYQSDNNYMDCHNIVEDSEGNLGEYIEIIEAKYIQAQIQLIINDTKKSNEKKIK